MVPKTHRPFEGIQGHALQSQNALVEFGIHFAYTCTRAPLLVGNARQRGLLYKRTPLHTCSKIDMATSTTFGVRIGVLFVALV